MRPQLATALPQLWRDEHSVQLGVDPRRAIVLSGLHSGMRHVMAALDGQHTLSEVARIGRRHGVSETQLSDLLEQLAAAHVLLDGHATPLPQQLPSAARRRIQPDLAALSLNHYGRAASVIGHRTTSTVVIYGEGRIAPIMGALLASSGVGRIHIYGPTGQGKVAIADACVGGLLPSDEHRSYTIAAHEAIHRSASEADTRLPHPSKVPEFVVLARGSICSEPQLSRHAHAGAPHLPVLLRDGIAIVGPLVIPGITACLSCLDLHRKDRDPAWPALASQLATYTERPEPSHAAVAAAAAALACMQVLAFLDGEQPTTVGASLELDGLSSPVRRRTWQAHPECRCQVRSYGSGVSASTKATPLKPTEPDRAATPWRSSPATSASTAAP